MTVPFLPGEMKSNLQYCPVLKKQARKKQLSRRAVFPFSSHQLSSCPGYWGGLTREEEGFVCCPGKRRDAYKQSLFHFPFCTLTYSSSIPVCGQIPCQSNWLLQIDLGIEDLCCKLVPPQRSDSLSNWLRFKCWKCHYHLKTKMIQENMHANK